MIEIKTTKEITFDLWQKNKDLDKKWVSCDDEIEFLKSMLEISQRQVIDNPYQNKLLKRIKQLEGEK